MGEPLLGIDPSSIQKVELFSSLLPKEMDFVISRSGVLQLRRGGHLFFPGERADHFYMLVQGSIRVFKPRADGGEDEMARFTSGDTIGDFDFGRGAEYDAYAEAVDDSVLIMFPGYGLTMDSLAQEEPHTVSRILLESIKMMTNRIKSTQKSLVESWQELNRQAYEDPGTGLWNQAFLTEEINRILETPSALIMLKPDRFKILVDSRGHGAGDEAMVQIAGILKKIVRRFGRGWSLRFKSNETGIFINSCTSDQAEMLAKDLSESVAALEPVPARGDIPVFSFSGTVSWAAWPDDDPAWESLMQGNYALLLDTWRAGGNQVIHYRKGAVK